MLNFSFNSFNAGRITRPCFVARNFISLSSSGLSMSSWVPLFLETQRERLAHSRSLGSVGPRMKKKPSWFVQSSASASSSAPACERASERARALPSFLPSFSLSLALPFPPFGRPFVGCLSGEGARARRCSIRSYFWVRHQLAFFLGVSQV